MDAIHNEQMILFIFAMAFMLAPFIVLAVISYYLKAQARVYRVKNWPQSNDWRYRK